MLSEEFAFKTGWNSIYLSQRRLVNIQYCSALSLKPSQDEPANDDHAQWFPFLLFIFYIFPFTFTFLFIFTFTFCLYFRLSFLFFPFIFHFHFSFDHFHFLVLTYTIIMGTCGHSLLLSSLSQTLPR